MTKTEFDAALIEVSGHLGVLSNGLLPLMNRHNLRIVPSDPVAWVDGIHRGKVPRTFEHARSPGHPICATKLYADPEDSK